MAFNKWTKDIPSSRRGGMPQAGSSHLEDGLLSVSSTSTSRAGRSEFTSITDKINKALQDIDNIYDDQTSADPLLQDIHSELSSMQNGELKVKLTSFLQQYEQQNQITQDVQEQRDEVLNSLAEWFSEDHLGDDFFSDSPASESLVESAAETKLGFTQLRNLNQQIVERVQRGESVKDLHREKEELQKSVLEGFKETKDIKHRETLLSQLEEPGDKSGWKQAAGEIVDLLSNVRGETADYARKLEKKVNELVSDREKADRKIRRLDNVLREKQVLEKKWTDNNNMLTREKADLENKFRRLKKEFRNARKKLAKHEQVARSAFDRGADPTEGADDDDDTDSGHVLQVAQLRDTYRQIEALQRDVKQLQEKVSQLENLVEEKEEEVDSLTHDKAELLHQMKHAAIRPDVRKLSDTPPSGPSIRSSSTHIIVGRKAPTKVPGPGSAVQLVQGRCSNCGCHQEASQHTKTSVAAKVEPQAAVKVKDQVPATTAPTPARERPPAAPETDSQTLEEVSRLRDRVATLEKHLSQASQEIIHLNSLKQPPAPTLAPYPTPVPTADTDSQSTTERLKPVSAPSAGQTQTQVHATQVLSLNVTETDRAVEKSADVSPPDGGTSQPPPGLSGVQERPPADLHGSLDALTNLMTNVAQTTWVRRGVNRAANNGGPDQDAMVCLTSQGMQTDPRLDPLSGWAQPTAREQGWRPPMPPLNWVEFDPTVVPPGGTDIGADMLRGKEPSELRQDVEDASAFLEKQLLRLVQGVQGLRDYIGLLIDRETKEMVDSNRKLKAMLTPVERRELNMVMGPTTDSDTKGAVDGRLPLGVTGVKAAEEEGESVAGRLKGTLGGLTNRTVQILGEALSLVEDALRQQQAEYEEVYSVIQRRRGSEDETLGPTQEVFFQPQIKRSISDTALGLVEESEEGTESGGVVGYSLNRPRDGIRPRRSHSHADVIMAEQHMEGMVVDRSVGASRKALHVSQAIVPKKGQIQLVSSMAGKRPELTTTDFNPFGVRDTERRKTKPAPINHQKLQSRQNALLKKNMAPRPPRLLGPSVKMTQKQKSVLAPTDPEEYTLADLERRVDHFVEKSAKDQKTAMIEQLTDAATSRRPGLDAMATSLPPLNPHDTVLPPIGRNKPDPEMRFPPLNA